MWCFGIRRFVVAFNSSKPASFRSCRCLNSKIPSVPFGPPVKLQNNYCKTRIDKDTVAHLERLSLVDFGNEKGIKVLEDAVAFAEQITTVNTKDIEPLITVLENSELRLREDIVADGNICKEVLSNASITEEDYFVAPPGNIPVVPKSYQTDLESQDESSDDEIKDNKLIEKQTT